MLMTWDERKREKNLRDHGFDFVDARDRFEWGTALILPTYSSQHGGRRFIAIGVLDAAIVTLIFSRFGSEADSSISLLSASNKERRRYAQE